MLASALVALLLFLGAASAAPLDRRDTGVYIYAGRDNKCLSLPVGATPGDGTPVVSLDCARAGLSKWDINRGSGSVVLTGTNFALDIGLNPGNNGPLKVWTSYPTAPQQTWYYTDDNRIAQTGGNQCLDEGDNGIQTYQCTTGNTNQIFYTRSGGVTPPSSSSVMPSSTSSASPPPASSSATPPPSGGSLIKANAYDNLCLTVRDANIYDGNPVQMSPCASAGDSERSQQVWQVAPGTTGPIRLPGTNKCLDAGNNPADGSGVKIWQCYDGLLQQTWSVGANGLFALSNNQCLNVQRETGSFVQTWTCSASDPQDQFSVVAA